MAKLIGVCRDDGCHFGSRQLPLVVDDTLTLVTQFTDACMACNNNVVKNKDVEMFTQKYGMLTSEELGVALMASSKEIFSMLSQVVSCVGCRGSAERLFQQLVDCGHPALEPLIVSSNGLLTLNNKLKFDPKSLCTFFHVHGPRLSTVIDSIPKSKKNRRCLLHSLDLQRINRPMGNWIEVWELMSRECQEEAVIVEAEMLLDTLDTYLRKHRFCTECKSKVMRAYNILIGDVDPSKEKGYLPALYYGIRSCPLERHVHVLGETQFLSHLIVRAEPELKGGYNLCSQRERHAKTIEIAQEEVLTCLGIYLYERLHRIWQRLQEMEQIWQILFHVGVDCLKKNFELSIEEKRGYSQLELLCEEISKAEKAKELKKELKRQKKKKRKEIKARLKQDEKEDQERKPSQFSDSVEPCCNKRISASDSNLKNLHNIIGNSSENISCTCDDKCDMDIVCCREQSTMDKCIVPNYVCSSCSPNVTTISISRCCKCKEHLNQKVNLHSDPGYYSSGSINSKCGCRDCLRWNSNLCHNSEVFNEGDNNSCHSDQSLDSVSSGAFSDPFYKCRSSSDTSQERVYFSSHSPRSTPACQGSNTMNVSSCTCAMCSCGNSCSVASSLQEMLQDTCSFDDVAISDEEIRQFHAQQPEFMERRRQLRQALKMRFANFRLSAGNLNSLIKCKTVS